MPEFAASVIIADRARATAAYRAALGLAVEKAASAALGAGDVAGMRALGGWTAITGRAVEAAIAEVEGTGAEVGSKLIPTTVAEVLRRDAVLVSDAARIVVARRLSGGR